MERHSASVFQIQQSRLPLSSLPLDVRVESVRFRQHVAHPPMENEQACITLLFNKYRAPLHRYLHGLVGSADDVLDLVQETYIRVIPHSQALRIEPVARAYLFRTATNIANEHYRRRVVRRHKDHFPLEGIEIESQSLNPELECLLQEKNARLKAELSNMPKQLLEVINLKYFELRTYTEIAVALGICSRTVERRVARAIKLLAARMEALQ